MKTIVQDVYGSVDVLELREVDRPAPAAGEVVAAQAPEPRPGHGRRRVDRSGRREGDRLHAPSPCCAASSPLTALWSVSAVKAAAAGRRASARNSGWRC
ncbi:hypothetical protein [Streptomyces varsoviensis]|uniref:hypothetical protein n=1 Tax=Streptomyces varsoviensis TaxID=67373 RepID=UPI0012FF1509|nr:hypothetical protein [Streptomyces varsoviensis]